MRMSAGAAVVALAVSLGASAAEAGVDFDVYGTVTSQVRPGTDPNISVGDRLHLTAHVSDDRIVKWGDYGYSIAFLYDLPVAGADYFHVDLGRLTWGSRDDFTDGEPWYFRYGPNSAFLGGPAIVFNGGEVLGVVGNLFPVGDGPPVLDLGSVAGFGVDDLEFGISSFRAPELSDRFGIGAPNCEYFNCYPTPGFRGVWSFPTQADVPEPATWTLLILGFATVGGSLRRKLALQADGRHRPLVRSPA